jgi:P-type Ca2+ transporter type 2C
LNIEYGDDDLEEASVNTEKSEEYYNKNLKEIYEKFKVEQKKGLSTEQAQASLEKYGPNELKKVKKSLLKVILAPLLNLLIIIYLISAFAMAALGEVQRTVPTFIIVGANCLIAIIQQLRAEKQMEALQKLSSATATVIRDGKEVELATHLVVLGDIVKLKQGDKIPADCRIIESRNLLADEASLTGESEPVKKSRKGGPIAGEKLPIQDQKNMIFLGTFVSAGQCTAIVVKIGSNTEIGKISTLLEESSTGEIPLRKKMNNFAKILGIGVVVLLVFSIIYKSIILTAQDNMSGANFKIAMIDSIDLGMKVMPINLPLLTTIVLLTGVLAMASKGVIVRELSRTESLGRVSIVCSDKTGTLTKNEMTVLHVWTTSQEYEVTGFGYDVDGKVIIPSDKENPVKNENLDLLTISGYLNNNSTLIKEEVETLGKGKSKISWSIIGLPTEASLKVLGQKYITNIEQLAGEYKFFHEFGFDSSIKRMSKLYEKDGKLLQYSKGATEWTLPLCSQYYEDGKTKQMTNEVSNTITENMKRFAGEGYRILTITYRELNKSALPKDMDDAKSRTFCEQEMVFLGFVVILDPPRDDVSGAVEECKGAGIKVIMITGDSISTGRAIATKLGIFTEGENLAIEGREVGTLTDEDFPKVTCYGRVSPEHKQIIIQRYQKMGKVVSMSGDGVNDALALSMADCGLAMGIAGTEVAKEAADMIITDDSFSTIITGVEEGRGLFMKIRTIIYFFICISIMEAVILFSSTLGPDPFFAMFDYWQLNLLYVTAHMFPSLGFTFGNNAKAIMDEKPRDSAEIITKPILKIMVIHMILMGAAIAGVYYLCLYEVIPVSDFNLSGIGPTNADPVPNAQIKARTMAFMVLFILESLIMPLQIRRINQSLGDSLRDIDYKKEFLFYLPSILALIGLIYNLEVQQFLIDVLSWNSNFMFLDFYDWLICLAFCLPGILGFELIRKGARNKGIKF